MAFHVITALVVASAPDGSQVYLYEGAPVPEGIVDKEIARLVEGGFIASDEEPTPDGDPSESWTKDQLTAYAGNKGVDVSAAKTKAEIVAAIAAATA